MLIPPGDCLVVSVKWGLVSAQFSLNRCLHCNPSLTAVLAKEPKTLLFCHPEGGDLLDPGCILSPKQSRDVPGPYGICSVDRQDTELCNRHCGDAPGSIRKKVVPVWRCPPKHIPSAERSLDPKPKFAIHATLYWSVWELCTVLTSSTAQWIRQLTGTQKTWSLLRTLPWTLGDHFIFLSLSLSLSTLSFEFQFKLFRTRTISSFLFVCCLTKRDAGLGWGFWLLL